MKEQLARALGLPDYWLEMDPDGEGIPSQLVPLALARSLNCSPQAVREWPDEDVLDQLMWMDVEGRLSRMRAKDLERSLIR